MMTEQVIQVALYLGLIIGLILLFGFAAKKIGQQNTSNTGGMKVVSSLALGMKEKLVLVQVGEQQLLLGVTPTNISRIESFEGVVVDQDTEGFRQKLQEIMQQGR